MHHGGSLACWIQPPSFVLVEGGWGDGGRVASRPNAGRTDMTAPSEQGVKALS